MKCLALSFVALTSFCVWSLSVTEINFTGEWILSGPGERVVIQDTISFERLSLEDPSVPFHPSYRASGGSFLRGQLSHMFPYSQGKEAITWWAKGPNGNIKAETTLVLRIADDGNTLMLGGDFEEIEYLQLVRKGSETAYPPEVPIVPVTVTDLLKADLSGSWKFEIIANNKKFDVELAKQPSKARSWNHYKASGLLDEKLLLNDMMILENEGKLFLTWYSTLNGQPYERIWTMILEVHNDGNELILGGDSEIYPIIRLIRATQG